jgi:hypothetical protein
MKRAREVSMPNSTVIARGPEAVAVSKGDLIAAWSILERVVVSLHKMGSHFATSSPDQELEPSRHLEMLGELDRFFTPELMRELSKARGALASYLPEDEAEALSDRLAIWKPTGN